MDDPGSRKPWQELHVNSVPVTCFFDSVGTPVYECSGCLDDQKMNRILRDIYVDTNAANYDNSGWSYAQLGQYTKALDDFNKAIAINPKYAKAYYGRGEVFEKLGKTDLAEKDKTKAKELGYVDPKSK